MRRSVFSLLLLLTTPWLASCDDFTLSQFMVDEKLTESTVQGVGLRSSLPSVLASIPMDLKSQDSYGKESFDYVTEITLDSVVLSISDKSDDPDHDSFEDGNEDNFDFVSSLEVTISAQFGDRIRSEVVAFLNEGDPQIATSTRTLQLRTSDVDIVDFVEADGGYVIEISGRGGVPSDDVIFGGSAEYQVGVGFN